MPSVTKSVVIRDKEKDRRGGTNEEKPKYKLLVSGLVITYILKLFYWRVILNILNVALHYTHLTNEVSTSNLKMEGWVSSIGYRDF